MQQMTKHRFFDHLKSMVYTRAQAILFLGNESIRDIVSSRILCNAEFFGYRCIELNTIVTNIELINELIDDGTAYYRQYKKQTLDDLFRRESRSPDPIVDVHLSASFY